MVKEWRRDAVVGKFSESREVVGVSIVWQVIPQKD
jgi:hypothetical protein